MGTAEIFPNDSEMIYSLNAFLSYSIKQNLGYVSAR